MPQSLLGRSVENGIFQSCQHDSFGVLLLFGSLSFESKLRAWTRQNLTTQQLSRRGA